MTGGSVSIRGWHQPFRELGATARELLLSAAARLWGVTVSECNAAKGFVRHTSSGRKLGYGELVETASSLHHLKTQVENPGPISTIGQRCSPLGHPIQG